MSKRVVVTGASGFIGGHLVDRLLSDDEADVLALDLWMSEEIAAHDEDGRLEFVQGDVLDRKLLDGILRPDDVVVHLAGILGTSETIELIRPIDAAEANIIGTLNILEALRERRFEKLVFISVPEVPWLNPYQITKRAAEKFCLLAVESYGCNIAILRLGNVYGARERWREAPFGAPYNYEKIIPTFVVNSLTGKPIVVYGDGEQSASYVYVDDAVTALEKAIAADESVSGQIVSIGRPETFSVNEIARAVIEATDSEVPIERHEMRAGEVKFSIRFDPEVAGRLLGFQAQVDLPTGLARTVPYYARVLRESAGVVEAGASGRG